MEHERMEHEERERTGVARSQNVLYLLPHDPAVVPQFLGPALERLDPEGPAAQLLVLTPDADTAATIAASVARAGSTAPVFPVTSPRRAARLLPARRPRALAGAPEAILELVRASAVKLEHVNILVLAWADALAEGPQADALETVLAEVPKDAARAVVAAELTPAVEGLVERYARRARRVGGAPGAEAAPIDIRYVTVTPRSRLDALRRVLDELDPRRGAVYAHSDAAMMELDGAVALYGADGAEGGLVVTRGEPVPDADLLVLYEIPLARETLDGLGAARAATIALVAPAQLPALRALAAGGRLVPLPSRAPADRARARDEAMRAELRRALAAGVPSRELLALQPLLDEYDGTEIAAAAMRLLERERERQAELADRAAATAPPAGGAAGERAGGASGVVRLFLNAGARDNVTARDVVGAISNEAGVPGAQIGKIEVRENHTIVEVPAAAAERIVAKLSGASLRGRRLVARVDAERPRAPRSSRGDEGGPRGARGPRGGGRGPSRPPRSRSE